MIGPYLPVLTETVLLPFKGVIVYDGLMSSYNISFGGGIRRSLNESFKEAKVRHGIVTSLPRSEGPVALPATTPKAKAASEGATERRDRRRPAGHRCDDRPVLPRAPERRVRRPVPQAGREAGPQAPVALAQRQPEHLGQRHRAHRGLGQLPAATRARPRTCGFATSTHGFGISESSGAAKLAAIRKLLKIHQLDPNWTLPSRLDANPLVWTLEVNGFMMDVRHAPREVQEIAFKKGLIPYIPADRRQGGERW